jgi:hypothetical protein
MELSFGLSAETTLPPEWSFARRLRVVRCSRFFRECALSSPPRLPEFMYALSVSESLIQRAETAVSKYGPKLKIIAG